ncbi:HTH-type transcriptional activator RhaR [Dyadobacter sp. CECT 9275]|uniref:HTH-type transcriptional activator RhaR n=1 Tax=Dyadobacter helix TaxID=2822344 RepID=A0A916JBA5_9BACT|nr:AraC family transcriptional regulator [Dyadobacter sp. CECT 9275]CAG5000207.1 HTH-type transcriptional activator RhaR [Dyadobacter sp. CECT 9275]
MRKSRGFDGEQFIEIPKVGLSSCRKLPLIQGLHITHIGFYPKALHHYYQRPRGIHSVIVIYCSDGKGWLQIENHKVNIRAGEIFVIPADTPHSYGADAKNPWSIYWVHVGGSLCMEIGKAIMRDSWERYEAIYAGFSEERTELFKQMVMTLRKGYSTSNLTFANLTLSYYLSTFINPEHFGQQSNNTQKMNTADKAIVYMQQHLSETVTLENIAGSVNLSVSFFSRKFKEDTGYTPIAYFNYLRIQKACQLLHFSDLRINEVASQIGIDDPFYFSRLFKHQMGVSPITYRRSRETL